MRRVFRHRPGRISAPVRAREARPYPYGPDAPGKVKARACPRPYPPWHERTLRLAARITTGVPALPAASVRAFREFAIELQSTRLPNSGAARGWVGRPKNRCPHSQSARTLKIGRRAILKIEVARRASTVSASHEAAGPLTREPPRPPARSLIFCQRTRKPRRILKS